MAVNHDPVNLSKTLKVGEKIILQVPVTKNIKEYIATVTEKTSDQLTVVLRNLSDTNDEGGMFIYLNMLRYEGERDGLRIFNIKQRGGRRRSVRRRVRHRLSHRRLRSRK